jgi:hypothetical protein
MTCGFRRAVTRGRLGRRTSYDDMSDAPDDEPRESSDLWILFAALVFGAVLIVSPAAATWIMRAGLLAAAVLMARYIRSVGPLVRAGAWRRSSGGMINALVGLAVLGFWIWYLARGFLAGKWIDAGLASILVAEFAYLEWLKRGRGGGRRSEGGKRR